MTASLSMFKASLLSIVRDKQLMGGAITFPVIFLLAFAAFDMSISGTDLGSAGGIDYYNFVVPGLLAMTAMEFSVSWTSATYARFKETKVLRRLDVTPIRRSSFMIGQVSARTLVATVQAVAVLLIAILLGADFVGSPLLLVLLAVLAGITFMALGFAVGARSSGVESATVLSGMIVLPVIFLSGAFFPISGLPDWLEPIVEALPMAPLLDAMRSVAIDGAGLGDIAGEVLTVLAWIPVTFFIALLAMRPRQPKTKKLQPSAHPSAVAGG